MKSAAVLLSCVFCLAVSPVIAADRPASDASVKRLLEVTDTRKMLDTALSQMDELIKSSIKQAAAGQSLTPEQEAVKLETQGKMVALLKEELNWDFLEPMYIEAYRKTFTQKEINAMLSFYTSPAGRAVTSKMPLVMQNSMQTIQERMSTLAPKIQQLCVEGTEKMKHVSPQGNGG